MTTPNRVTLTVKCPRSRHIVGRVVATVSGQVVNYRALLFYPGGSRLQWDSEPLDGPADDPQSWTTPTGCPCGMPISINNADLHAALGDGRKVLVLKADDPGLNIDPLSALNQRMGNPVE